MSVAVPKSPKLKRRKFEKPKETDERTEGQKDFDRILYTSAFMRLGGVSQVAHADDSAIVHNRLTHALKVSTLGRGLANRLIRQQPEQAEAIGGIDADIVAAAALAHDLGHPPFGHMAEKQLREILEKEGRSDSFEGNAQSFRVVTKLSVRKTKGHGLNLTRGTLNAILKYPWQKQDEDGKRSEKWGAYSTETDDFNFARKGSVPNRKSIEAEIMDYADDVAYSTHDLEDFYRAGLLPLDRLLTDRDERARFVNAFVQKNKKWSKTDAAGVFDTSLTFAVTPALNEPYHGLKAQRGGVRAFCSTLIDRFFDGISLSGPDPKKPLVRVDPEIELEIALLKHLMWHYVICHQSVATQEHGQKTIIQTLFNIYREELMPTKSRKKSGIVPERYREFIDSTRSKNAAEKEIHCMRVAVDIIAEMTEHQAVQTYLQLTGHSTRSVLDSAHR